MSVKIEQAPRTLWERVLYPFRRGVRPEAREAVGFFTDTSLCIGCKACQVACKQWNMLPAEPPRLSGHSYDNTLDLSARTWRHVKFLEEDRAAACGANTTNGPGGTGGDSPDMEPLRPAQGGSPAVSPGGASGGAAFSLDAVPRMRWLFASDSCKHCADPPCLRACPTGALVQSEFGTVYPQADICNGCASCVAACPFGVIARDEASGHSHKCTLCLDRLRDGLPPACAKTCPTGSIRFGALTELRDVAAKRLTRLREGGESAARLYGMDPSPVYPELHVFYLLLDEPRRYGLPDAPRHPASLLGGDYMRAGAGLAAALGVVVLSLWAGV